jgi:selenoprotein W-related protein
LTSKVLTQFKQKLLGLELQPSSGGCFEVSVDGQLIYSKLATGQFPDEDAILAMVGQHLKPKA